MTLYPEIEPYRTGKLAVSDLHILHYEESGNPEGAAVIYLHGGPGEGIHPRHRRNFDPGRYRIVHVDQRGCGNSTPHACLIDNTTWDLVEDLEKLRVELGVEKWLVCGGSWGSALALAYAETHPSSVSELIIWGTFLVRRKEIDWYYQNGANALYPDLWEKLASTVPPAERHDLLGAFHRRLTGSDPDARRIAAKAWSEWEGATVSLVPQPTRIAAHGDADFADAFARIETHYFKNEGFMDDGQILRDIDRIRHIPCTIIQGRYDIVTPMMTAWELHLLWPEATLVIVDDCGHSSSEPGISSQIVAATDRYAKASRAAAPAA